VRWLFDLLLCSRFIVVAYRLGSDSIFGSSKVSSSLSKKNRIEYVVEVLNCLHEVMNEYQHPELPVISDQFLATALYVFNVF